ncbi:hypothetical protein M758_1G190200 [Ceratodon purpureus]|nr:hypothetical protein M758_1G190200 [Ceratodon purpureus]
MSRVLVRELGAGRKLLRPRVDVLPRSVSTVAQDAGVQKTGRGGAVGLVAVLGGVAIVGGSYYAMTLQPQPRPLPPATVQNLPPAVPAPVPAAQPPSPFAPPAVSARDELVQRMESLKSELELLRKQKRDKLIDMKKKAIKEDIQTIKSALASFDKQ